MSIVVSSARTGCSASPQARKEGTGDAHPVPLLCLFAGAVLWLFVALTLGLIDSLKFHNPEFLAGEPYLSYGRVHAAQNTALLYGFGVPVALGLGLWLLCRLGRAALAAPWVVLLGALFWNFALAAGVAAVLCGGRSGYEGFEFPAWCAPLLFVAYILIGVCAFVTFDRRREEKLYPSQWFVIGALFWFPWIFSTAGLLLLAAPARGVLQALIACWCAHNLSGVFLGFAGLASSFYFIPKILGRPLHSHYLAALAFWTIALFGSCGGVPNGAPVPAWIVSLSVVGTGLTIVPLLAVATNFYLTVRRDLEVLDADPTLRFTYVGLMFWLIAGAQQIAGALPGVSAITDFTWFGAARSGLFHNGFFGLTVFGALYYILPRLLGLGPAAWRPGLLKAHFFLAFLGVLITYVSLVSAGVGQGILLSDARNSFADVMRRTMLPLRVSTLGELMILVGTVLFLLNFARILILACRRCRAEAKERA
jgi:cytochrome c oxidase cbb3-type subunit 1